MTTVLSNVLFINIVNVVISVNGRKSRLIY